MEITVLQSQKIVVVETKFNKQLANIAMSSDNSIPRWIIATIDTSISSSSTSGGSIVTKGEMMQMFTQFTQNFQQGQCTEIASTGTKVSGKKKGKFGTNYIPNDLGGGQQSKRLYPESTIYCPSCGYDIKPTHTPVTCTNWKTFHNKATLLDNQMGGVSTNCHFINE